MIKFFIYVVMINENIVKRAVSLKGHDTILFMIGEHLSKEDLKVNPL